MADPLILTNVGLAKLASATPEDQLKISSIAVGDGNGNYPPLNPSMTALVNEVWRGTSSEPIRDAGAENVLIFETVIPASVGGFFIREVGLFDDTDAMIAIGQVTLVEKPASGSGSPLTMTVRVRLALANAAQTNLIISDQAYIDHQALSNRDAPNAHPMSSISGLVEFIGGLGTASRVNVGIGDDDVPSNADLFKSADLIVTVGAGGDYATINAALTALSRYAPLYKKDGFSAEIRLLYDFVMQEQVIVVGVDMGWITITSDDYEVPIKRSSLTTRLDIDDNIYPAFAAVRNATLPAIGALFDMDSSGEGLDRHGIVAVVNSRVTVLYGAGVKNAGGHGLAVGDSSSASANSTIFSGAEKSCVRAWRSSTVNANLADCSGAGENGVSASNGAYVNASGADCTGAGANAVLSRSGSIVNAPGAQGAVLPVYVGGGIQHATFDQVVALTSNIGPVMVENMPQPWYWVQNQYFTGYRSPMAGLFCWGATEQPLPHEIDAIGQVITENEHGGAISRFRESGLVVSSSEWKAGEYRIASLGGGMWKAPDMRNQFIRATGTDADTANARTIGSHQLDAMQELNGRFSLNRTDVLPSQHAAFGVFDRGDGPSQTGATSSMGGTAEVVFSASRVARVAKENRSINTALAARIYR